MARPLRVQFAGALYHVTARGNARQDIFIDDVDRVRFLDSLWSTCNLLDWDVWADCLMGNHYHLLLQTPTPTLSRGMRDLVEKESYLPEVARYILLNPVRAGLCKDPGLWPRSSYRATTGRARVAGRLVAERLIRELGEGRWKSLDQYEAETDGRNDAMRSAYASGTHTFAEIGRHFGLHYVTVARIVRRAG